MDFKTKMKIGLKIDGLVYSTDILHQGINYVAQEQISRDASSRLYFHHKYLPQKKIYRRTGQLEMKIHQNWLIAVEAKESKKTSTENA